MSNAILIAVRQNVACMGPVVWKAFSVEVSKTARGQARSNMKYRKIPPAAAANQFAENAIGFRPPLIYKKNYKNFLYSN
jgi:hypothetical protein